jgi:hypothetical protein
MHFPTFAVLATLSLTSVIAKPVANPVATLAVRDTDAQIARDFYAGFIKRQDDGSGTGEGTGEETGGETASDPSTGDGTGETGTGEEGTGTGEGESDGEGGKSLFLSCLPRMGTDQQYLEILDHLPNPHLAKLHPLSTPSPVELPL